MTFVRHLTEFGGLPVLDFEPHMQGGADDGMFAWRISVHDAWRHDDARDAFRELFAAFLDAVDPAAVTALVIGNWGGPGHNASVAVTQLEEHADRLTNLRAVFLGDMVSEECEISWIDQCAFTLLLDAYPRLEELGVRGGGGYAPQPVTHPSLRRLVFESGNLSAKVVQCVAASSFPALQHLEIWCGSEYFGGDVTAEDIDAVITGMALPRLTHLGLRNSDFTDDIARRLAAAPVTAGLEVLDLSLGTLSDAGAEALLAGQPLTHLRRLDLHHHYLGAETAARVRDALAPAGVDVDLRLPVRTGSDGQRYSAVAE